MNPSIITGMFNVRARTTAPAMAANSRPPKQRSASIPDVASGFAASPRVTASALRASPSSSTPVPRPTQSSADPPNRAAAIAAAAVVLPMPISPVIKISAFSSTASHPVCRAAINSASLIAGPAVKSAVGVSKSSAITSNFAPKHLDNWLIAAPPA